MKVVVATLVCDRKAYSAEQIVKSNTQLETPEGVEKLVYVNIESTMSRSRAIVKYAKLMEMADAYDLWTWTSSWRGNRKKDQDQGYRLPAIVTGRNMAREYAMRVSADAILYIDSDVLVPMDSIGKLLEVGEDIVSGVVPGRGVHSHVQYMGSGLYQSRVRHNVITLDYATAGFALIRSNVFRMVPWRWGWTRVSSQPWSEDPIFGYDAREAGFGWWHVRTDLRAQHLDDPSRPLTEGQTAGF